MRSSLVLFPGLGADASLFFEQARTFGEKLITPGWINPQKGESLGHYCHRYADELGKGPLAHLRELYLGGFSFGGMVALELASILSKNPKFKIQGVLLISSGRSNQIIGGPFKLQAALSRFVPASLLKLIVQKQMLGKFLESEPLNLEAIHCLKNMATQIDIHFFKWAVQACAQWSPGNRFVSPSPEFPIFEIQGEKDSIIPFSKEPGVITLKNAKHLIQYTHAKEVNQWLETTVE